MAKPNYRQVKRQKEMARKNRQQEKLDRRVSQAAQTANEAVETPVGTSPGGTVVGEASADIAPSETAVTGPSDARA